MKRVAELVGVQERYLARAVRSGGVAAGLRGQQARTAAVHRRFYAAMALHELACEVPLPTVVKKYGCTRGVLQSLQQSAATFAGTRCLDDCLHCVLYPSFGHLQFLFYSVSQKNPP